MKKLTRVLVFAFSPGKPCTLNTKPYTLNPQH